jgi:hypothetical protein
MLATEAAALETIAAVEVPGPRLVAVATGGPAAPGLFALVMTRVPGTRRCSSTATSGTATQCGTTIS